ncbi:photosynthetic complex assembly protein PuhC [Porphyrobacter sp. YT40]|uniref:photosynthetic complex assembly protein PuhC n=1 Tax=Porphyrobacter sp. YT40 TaxID=2547601 RepID=UPI0011433A81|nr:photosynthetic complex assembly protein PuhC [Porphyrobacter sp. YT40]QDH34134.1 photosynthetic complex assembly protein [Porphyrobacter sp. YT40]
MIVREYEKDEITVHKVPLALMGGVIAISVALTASVTMGFLPKQSVPSEARAAAGVKPAQQRTLRFFDEADGTVRVEDGATAEVLARYGQGEGGFVRASVRSLVHQRRIRDIGSQVPFTLTRWDTGALTLSDPETGVNIEITGFGPENRAIYASLLPKPEAAR